MLRTPSRTAGLSGLRLFNRLPKLPVGKSTYHRHFALYSRPTKRSSSLQSRVMAYPEPLVFGPKEKHSASVIMIHGLGDSGEGWAPFGPELGQDLPYVKFLFPTASQMPVSLNGGMRMNAWYDIYSLDRLQGREDTTNLKASADYIQKLVEKEIESGIPCQRILVAGFSQGGALALLSLRQPHRLAGVLCMSGYLTMEKEQVVSTANQETPLLMCHGEQDQVVAFHFGQKSHEYLREAGVKVDFKSYRFSGHSLDPQEIKDVKSFLKTCLPRI